MADEATKGADGQPEKKPEDGQPVKPTDKKEEKETTVGEVVTPAKKEEKEKPETVPLSAHLDLKKDYKEVKRKLDAIESRLEKGAESEDLVDDLDALAKEYDLDPKFIGKLSRTIEKRAEKRAETVADEKTKHVSAEAEEKRIANVFTENFDKAIKDMPEFGDIADRDDVFALSRLPKNANKTFKQLIEDTYGKAIGGKRTIEQTKPRGGKEPEEIDYDKAKRDTNYFKEIMSNPDSKKKYNDGLVGRIGHAL